MKKLIALILLSGMMGLSIIIFFKNNQDDLKITIGNKKILPTVADEKFNSQTDLFEYAFKKSVNNIEFIKKGEKVYLDFGDNSPDTFVVKDYLLDSQGKLMYNKKLIMDVPVKGYNNQYYFVLEGHIASSLSSFYEKDKKSYRGFAIITTKDDIEKTYLFVIKTDA